MEAGRREQRWATVTVLLVVAVLGGLTVLSRTDTRASLAFIVTDVVATLLACALVPVLVRWPVPGALGMAVLAAFSPAATPAATIAVLRVASQRPLSVAVWVGLASTVAHAIQGIVRPIPGLPYGWLLVIDVAVHLALVAWGALIRLREAARVEREQRAEEEQAERVAAARRHERATIAREMHDVLGHRLSLVAASAGALEYRPDASAEQVARAASVVRAGAHQALEELREVIGVLRADDLLSGDGPPQPTLADLPSLVGESREAGVTVELDNRVTDVPDTLGRTAYRIVQEGLTNARKHAAGEAVAVVVAGGPGEALRVEVRNRVPHPRASSDGRGTGLVGLGERAASVGGRLEHGVTSDGDFRVIAELPWPA
ncbi:two-component sensor histidine kinase [Actinomycetospora sp. NBRC 106375]|uniref:sensor histidine kinase n=1 Tax=Actinomycetospora sp. NBRC 106375 TaxID=3032207 RepID=UPI0024A2A6C7|nr:histidine kinase [Actinomycetospora sp. NBRC 106375]GLZ45915.1 two-component sensor histidine kinase [Actinomycetospora sp. NBRC 106375]